MSKELWSWPRDMRRKAKLDGKQLYAFGFDNNGGSMESFGYISEADLSTLLDAVLLLTGKDRKNAKRKKALQDFIKANKP